jgi:hypothetical protein
MKKQSTILAIAALALVLGLLYYFFLRTKPDECDYYVREDISSDAFMGPAFTKPFTAKVYPNWYKCHELKRGDVVRYSMGNPAQDYTRILGAIEGDIIKVVPDPMKRGWNLLVNDEVQMSAGTPYVFGIQGVRNTISLYMDRPDGTRKMNPGEIILFAIAGPGFNDSGLFGLFEKGFIRYVELPEEQKKIMDDLKATLFVSADKIDVKPGAGSAPRADTPAPSVKKSPAKPVPLKKKNGR